MQIVMEAENSSNMVLDPRDMSTLFPVLPKLDIGCYTTITYASLVGKIISPVLIFSYFLGMLALPIGTYFATKLVVRINQKSHCHPVNQRNPTTNKSAAGIKTILFILKL